MHSKLLVAVDQSPAAQNVLQQAMDLAQSYAAKLLLLHVISAEEKGSPIPIPQGVESMYWSPGGALDLQTWQRQWTEYEQQCLQDLKGLATQAMQAGIETDMRQVYGSPGRMICDVATDWAADLIVIGNQGRSGISELVLGSVSNYVMHHAPCSVLVVKEAAPD